MQRALITGASGFIGGHLATALAERGLHVRCLVRRTSNTDALQHAGIELVYGDVTDRASLDGAVAGCDTVFHLAGLVCALRYADLVRVNGEGSLHVADACAAQASPPTLIAVSSIAASGPTRRGTVRQEYDPATPVSYYGRSKRAGELAVLHYADRVPVSIVRPGMVFGPRDREFLQVMQSIRAIRAHVVPGFVTPALSLVHVEDLVEILVRCAERGRRCAPRHTLRTPERVPISLGTRAGALAASRNDQTGNHRGHTEDPRVAGTGVYFGVAPEHPDYAEIGHLVRPLLHRPAAWLVAMPTPLPWLVAGIAELIARARNRADVFNLDKIREGTAESWACSHRAVEQELDFHFPLSLRQRFEQTVAWYFEQGWL